MKKITSSNFAVFVCAVLAISPAFSQNWQWTELPSMPEPVANNAVVQAYAGDSLCVYSFCGVDETKSPAGIHLKSWRYNTVSQEWAQLPNVPDVQGKIGVGASVVSNKIYVIGGYYVNDDFSESTSDDVHIFDPESNMWLADGATILAPTDDHVQAVYKDSLILLVTGWSNTGNINDAQYYDPANDNWIAATPIPNGAGFRAFGASGSIVGDSVFYYGGVNSATFNANNKMRRGAIDPSDPSQIEWEELDEPPGEDGYRMAATRLGNEVVWIGGAPISYNFDGLSYATGLGVPPHTRIVRYNAVSGEWTEDANQPWGVMDLRGIAQVSPTSWIICGGMLDEQEVSDKAFLVSYQGVMGIDFPTKSEVSLQMQNGVLSLQNIPHSGDKVLVFNSNGQQISLDLTLGRESMPIVTQNFKNSCLVLLLGHSGDIIFSELVVFN